MAEIIQIKDGSTDVLPVAEESGSNYCKMPDGTLIQWGSFEVNLPANGYQEYNLTFPLRSAQGGYIQPPAFIAGATVWGDSRIYSIIRRAGFVDNGTFRIGNTASSASNGVIITWIAIGRWK